MPRKGSSFDATLLHLGVVNINTFEIDTKNGYEYHKISGYSLDKDGSTSAILSDVNNESVFRHVPIAKAIGLSEEHRRFCPDNDKHTIR